jgi:LacI family transcriptional regulator
MKIYTIKEIAKMAEVSSGTVDRVLHSRGKVSSDKELRVRKILKEIDYRPNQFARSLKLNKRYRFVVLMPDDDLDEYWKPCFSGINELKNTFEENGITVDILKYSPKNHDDFVEKSRLSIELGPDGVLLGALFLKESQKYLRMLEERAIPFGLINTAVEETNYHTFVGHNLIQSGRTAAHLFDNILYEKGSILIVHLEEEFENALHMQQKEKGFRAYFRDKGIPIQIDTVNLKANEAGTNLIQFREKLKNITSGIFVTTSKAYLIAEIGIDPRIPIIGYDLLLKNVQYLKGDKIKFLIYQNPKLQAYKGLSLLSEYVMKSIDHPKQMYLPIEIVSSENIDSYRF